MRKPLALALASTVAVAAALSAQAAYRGYVQSGDLNDIHNAPYDGRFTFFRVRYEPAGGLSRGWRVDRKWDHDVPRAEIHFMKIMRELSTLRPYMEGGNIFTLDDPEMFKYPIAYLSEPGYWIPSDAEVAGLRTYLAKGGFLIVDDFMRGEWANFERQIRRVLPDARIDRMDVAHPIFDSFFHIKSLDMSYPHDASLKAQFYGIYEDNDPSRRLLAIINYNNDIGDYMEWSGEGWWPVNITNDAYKLAVNYIIYGMTH